jgi:hypothetical protein
MTVEDRHNRHGPAGLRADNGARVGDRFMNLIYACQLNRANPFDYLTELQRHADELAASPWLWMPWNYRGAPA